MTIISRKSIGCLSFCLCVSIAALVAFRYSPFYQYFQHSFVTEYTQFDIPETNVKIEHFRIGIHPVMAEYNRWLAVIDNGKRYRTQELAIDTCGGYPINCYLVKLDDKLLLRLDDMASEHIVDLGNGSVLKSHFGEPPINADGGMDGTYLGCLDGKVGRLRFIPSSESTEPQIRHLWDR